MGNKRLIRAMVIPWSLPVVCRNPKWGSTMTLSRRFLIRLAIGWAPVLTPTRLRAFTRQEATPEPSWEVLRQGFVIGASREFHALVLRPIGASIIATGAFIFDSDNRAAEIFPMFIDLSLNNLTSVFPGVGPFRPASAPDLGDEAIAYVGSLTPPDDPNTTFVVGTFAWREGPIVYFAFAVGRSGDPLAEVFAIARAISGRKWTNGPTTTPTSSREMHSGGVWELLPTLEDMPEGFVLIIENLIPELGTSGESP